MSDTIDYVTSLSRRHADIVAEQYRGMTILRSAHHTPLRRIFYLNSYGMAKAWRLLFSEAYPGHNLWGCLELTRMGYEIAMPEEPNRDSRYYNYRRQDLEYIPFIKSWLGPEGIVYSAHTVLFWLPLLATLKLLRSPVVTLLYARGENLRFAGGYKGVIAMTPCSQSRAESLAPKAKVAHLAWGVDLPCYPELKYEPQWFLSCGKTMRDFPTLATAAAGYPGQLRIINTERSAQITWPPNVRLFTGGSGCDWRPVSNRDLIYEHYANCTAALIILKPDAAERYAAGFTQLLEAMAMARPVIVTRTGALAGELDVEKEGCGLFVPPNDAAALALAMKTIADNPSRAEAMGRAGRRLCETRYNIIRYANELHQFFESL